MKWSLLSVELFAKMSLLALLLALASCGKEPLVEPCGQNTDAQEAKAGGGETGSSTTNGANTNDEGNGDGAGISDDGDDIGDSEGRKKRPN